MYKAGYGEAVSDPIEQQSFYTAEQARGWLVSLLWARFTDKKQVGENTYKGFAAACLETHPIPVLWRGPDNHTYFVIEE